MKDKIKELISSIKTLTVPTSVFLAFCIKVTLFTATIPDAILMFALAGVYSYYMYVNRHRVVINNQLQEQIQRIENQVSSLQVALNLKRTHETQKKDKRFF